METTLATLEPGQKAIVSGTVPEQFRRFGITEGTSVTCLQKSPLKDPVAYDIRGTVLALRQKDAIEIPVHLHQEVETWD